MLPTTGVRLTAGRIEVTRGADVGPAPLRLEPSALLELSDVTVMGSEGAAVACHKCVLAARLEYFNMMLSSSWAEVRPEPASRSYQQPTDFRQSGWTNERLNSV